MEIKSMGGSKNIKNIFKGFIIANIISLVLLIIYAAILTYSDVSENTINPVIMIVTAISILIGGIIGTIKIEKNGLLIGAIIGGSYTLFLYLISSILNHEFSLNLQSVIIIGISVLFGMLGGILGVNIKTKR